MQLWLHSTSRLHDALKLIVPTDRNLRAFVRRSVARPFAKQDVGAALLGGDLWFPPLREFRSYVEATGERPHLWDFAFGPSGAWPSATWRSLPLDMRITRMRAGSLSEIAGPQELAVDLHLIEIIAHWLRMLDHADRVARDLTPSGYEVHGYDEACSRCTMQWGIRPRLERWIPPFHPGCRCFAQPRFAKTRP